MINTCCICDAAYAFGGEGFAVIKILIKSKRETARITVVIFLYAAYCFIYYALISVRELCEYVKNDFCMLYQNRNVIYAKTHEQAMIPTMGEWQESLSQNVSNIKQQFLRVQSRGK